MLRIVIWPVVIFAVLAAAAVLTLNLATPPQSLLKQKTIDEVMQRPSDSLRNALGDLLQQQPAQVQREDPRKAELDARQQNVMTVLIHATAAAMLAGLFLSMGWGFYASRREQDVFGPKGQRAAFPAWFGLLIGQLLVFVGCYFLILRDPAIDPAPTPFEGRLILVEVVAILGYWIATALAASSTMRPSVPLAGRFGKQAKGA